MRIIKTKDSAIVFGDNAVLSVTYGSSTVMVIAAGVTCAVAAHPMSLGTIFDRLLDRIGQNGNIDLDKLAGEVETLRLIRLTANQIDALLSMVAGGEVAVNLEIGRVLSSHRLAYQHGYLEKELEMFSISPDGLAWLAMNPETAQA